LSKGNDLTESLFQTSGFGSAPSCVASAVAMKNAHDRARHAAP
jgi:hypothetical protein